MQARKIVLIVMSCLLFASCARWKGGPERFYFGPYSEAEKFYNKGEYEKAIEKYQAYINENPEGNLTVISQYYIARSHASLGHTDEAKAIYKEIIEKHPDLVWAKFSDAQLQELDKKTPAQPATT